MIFCPKEEMQRRIERLSVKDPISGCWIWNGASNDKGYGSVGNGKAGKTAKAHRASYFAFVSDPHGFEVAHRCDNRSCVNPSHLFLATHKQNMEDCSNKGRTFRGDRNKKAKLSSVDVSDIRVLLSFNVSLSEIGRQFGVAAKTISMIRDGLNWRWA